jgi:glycosyltransferase involved in cell wall biosynthesis
MEKHIVIALNNCRDRTIGQYALLRASYFSWFYRVTVVSDSFPENLDSRFETLAVTPPKFNYLRRFAHVPNDLAFVLAVRRQLQGLMSQDPFDFMLCHSYPLAYMVGNCFKKSRGIPFGMFMHGHIFSRPVGTYDWRMTKYYRFMAPTCYARSDVIFALSREQQRLAIQAGADRRRVTLAPNGIDITDLGIDHEQVQSRSAFLGHGEPVRILYVGRFTREKGFEYLLAACKRMNRAGKQFNLTIIGGGMPRDIQKSIQSEGVIKRINYRGHVPRPNLGEHYLDADMLCVPSLDESQGNVVLEGMVSGCLVIGSHVGGIPDMIQDGENGYLFAPGDPEAIGRVIEKAVNDPRSAESVRKQGLDDARKKFGWSPIVDRMVQAIDDVTD